MMELNEIKRTEKEIIIMAGIVAVIFFFAGYAWRIVTI